MNSQQSTKQQGLTIIEIMIAILLSTLLLTGVIQIFVSTKHSYLIQDGLSRIQENGRFGVEIISRDLQMAGFYGCSDAKNFTNNLNTSSNLQFQYDFPVAGYNNVPASTPTLLSDAGIVPDANTDVIIIRRTQGDPFRLTQASTDTNIQIEAESTVSNFCADNSTMVNGFCRGDILMVADCNKAVVFQSGSITVTGTVPNQVATITHPSGGTPGNAAASWGGSGQFGSQFLHDANSEVYRVATIAYYVRTVNGIPTLFRYENGNTDALIDGVEDMQITYGDDTNGDGIANSYVNAFAYTSANQPRWSRIVGTKINFLVRSINNNLSESAVSYTFNGNTVATDAMANDDRFVRREFATTIALRNHAS